MPLDDHPIIAVSMSTIMATSQRIIRVECAGRSHKRRRGDYCAGSSFGCSTCGCPHWEGEGFGDWILRFTAYHFFFMH